MDPLLAARLQMAISLAFHMVFAAVGIGLPCLIVIAQGLYLKTGQQHFHDLAYKWAKVTGLLFAVGAVSGTALSLELGLLWPTYMEVMGAAVPFQNSPRSAKRAGIDCTVKSSGATSGSSSHATGAETCAPGFGRTL